MYDHLLYSYYKTTYFNVDFVMRIYILINLLGLKGLVPPAGTEGILDFVCIINVIHMICG